MTDVATELTHGGIVAASEVVAEVTGFVGPFRQGFHHAAQVEQTVVRGFHHVVAEVFGEGVGVVVTTFAAEPQTRVVRDGCYRQAVERGAFFELTLGVGIVSVAPTDRPFVVVVHTGEDAGLADVVFGLGDVVETRIVHDGRGVTVLFHPRFVAQILNRRGAARAHVVAQTERVADFVRGDEANELAHEGFVKFRLAGARIEGTYLRLIPIMEQFHHVVIPTNVAFDDFARARIVHIGAVGVGNGRGEVANHRETSVFEAHRRVVLRPFTRLDGVFETGLLKGFLPVLNSENKVLAPLFGCGGIDVVDDGFLGLDEFAATIFVHVFGAGLEAPTRNDLAGLHTLLVVGIFYERFGEIAHARIESAPAHRHARQEYERSVELQRHVSRFCAGGQGGAGFRKEGFDGGHLGVDGEGAEGVHIRELGFEIPEVEARFVAG